MSPVISGIALAIFDGFWKSWSKSDFFDMNFDFSRIFDD